MVEGGSAERVGQPGPVRVSTTTDDTFADLATHEHPFAPIMKTLVLQPNNATNGLFMPELA